MWWERGGGREQRECGKVLDRKVAAVTEAEGGILDVSKEVF